jgi:hypothetical protein
MADNRDLTVGLALTAEAVKMEQCPYCWIRTVEMPTLPGTRLSARPFPTFATEPLKLLRSGKRWPKDLR